MESVLDVIAKYEAISKIYLATESWYSYDDVDHVNICAKYRQYSNDIHNLITSACKSDDTETIVAIKNCKYYVYNDFRYESIAKEEISNHIQSMRYDAERYISRIKPYGNPLIMSNVLANLAEYKASKESTIINNNSISNNYIEETIILYIAICKYEALYEKILSKYPNQLEEGMRQERYKLYRVERDIYRILYRNCCINVELDILNGKSIIDMAKEMKHAPLIDIVQHYISESKRCRSDVVNTDIVSRRIHSLMLAACEQDNVKIARVIMEAGWDMYYDYNTYIAVVANKNSINVFKYLISIGYDVNALSEMYEPLMSSFHRPNFSTEMNALLLINGAKSCCKCSQCCETMGCIITDTIIANEKLPFLTKDELEKIMKLKDRYLI